MGKLIKNVMEKDFGMCQTDELNSYIENQLITLNTHLEKDVFHRVLNIFYQHILKIFLDIVEGEADVIFAQLKFACLFKTKIYLHTEKATAELLP